MLTCREVTARATDYMEWPLPLRERLQIGMHLLICAFCRIHPPACPDQGYVAPTAPTAALR